MTDRYEFAAGHMTFPPNTFSVPETIHVQRPASVELPNLALDQLLGLTEAELKVAIFVTRQTTGYGREIVTLTYNQIAYGVFGEDGRLLDRGTGLCHKSIGRAQRLLSDKGFLHITPTGKPRRNVNGAPTDPAMPTGTASLYSLGQRLRPVRNWIDAPQPRQLPVRRSLRAELDALAETA